MLIKNSDNINPFNVEATFLQSTRMERLLKTKLCHVGIHWIACDEYFQMSSHACARISVIIQFFLSFFVLAKVASCIRFNNL